MNPRIKLAAAVVAPLVALVALTGLAGCSDDGGSGGKTTCGAFEAMTGADREKVVVEMMRDRGEAVTEIDVRSKAILIDFYCANVDAGTTIDGVYTAG